MGRWKWSIQAISPADPDSLQWEVGVHQAKIRHLQQAGHEAKIARLRLVESVLQSPQILIEGWCRPDKDDCYVYVGKPATDFRSLSIECPPPESMLFLVFVLPDGTIDDWNWRPVAANDLTVPEDLNGKILWRAN